MTMKQSKLNFQSYLGYYLTKHMVGTILTYENPFNPI